MKGGFRLIVDTNVFISGVFFSGPPRWILEAWRSGQVKLVLSPEILEEYQATGNELASRFPGVDLKPWIELVTAYGVIVEAPPLPEQVCTDPDDDKFLACAIASGTKIITSGDKALLATAGFKGISILTPRQFVTQYLKE
jgi:putative PIN family toxin of toxin-antitoxin system